ncbi:hypothetical protein Q1695_005312 [Nippostrongylus brasiliensis]|nr:hypothetical protein Q1695_005312 [Nippostrongylus brasiliensis]
MFTFQETAANFEKESTLKSQSQQTQQTHHVKMMTEVSNQCHTQTGLMREHTTIHPGSLPPTAYQIPFQCSYPMPQGYPSAGGPQPVQWSYMQPIPISFVPPGTIPIPVQDLSKSIADGTPICPVTVAEQFAQMNLQNAQWRTMAPSVPVAIPIPPPAAYHGAPVDPRQDPHEPNVAVVPPMESHEDFDSSPGCSGSNSRRGTVGEPPCESERQRSASSATDFGAQVAERKRLEEQDAERDRHEEEKAMREKEEKARREADAERMRKEEERLKEQEKERVRRALEEALERAKHEAEITRKARVFKHVLEGAEKSPELERRLLGVDPETGDRILNEISQMERQKKLEREVIVKSSPKKGDQRDKSPSDRRSRSIQPKSRSSSVSGAAFITPEARGKSPSGSRPIASGRPSESADERVVKSAQERTGVRHPPCPASGSTPLRRSIPGRMSVRVTRKEKENTATDGSADGPTRSTGRTMMKSSHAPIGSVGQDHRMPPSKIPIATPTSTAARARSGSRPPPLPQQQPLRSANHFPAVESEALQLIKNIPVEPARPRTLGNLVSPEDFCDNPLYSPVATRNRRSYKMRGLTDSPVNMVDSAGSSRGSTEENSSSGSASPQAAAQSPVPSIVISHDTFNGTKSILTSNNNELKIRSALSSPAAYLNQTPRSSTYVKKLVEKGCNKHGEDALSPNLRRKAEANISRSPSVQSLRGSMGNLAGWRGSVSNLVEDPATLSRFRSLNPNYRSFNVKKNTEKQQEVIDRLSKLRENLRSRENFVERGVLPKHQMSAPQAAVKI